MFVWERGRIEREEMSVYKGGVGMDNDMMTYIRAYIPVDAISIAGHATPISIRTSITPACICKMTTIFIIRGIVI